MPRWLRRSVWRTVVRRRTRYNSICTWRTRIRPTRMVRWRFSSAGSTSTIRRLWMGDRWVMRMCRAPLSWVLPRRRTSTVSIPWLIRPRINWRSIPRRTILARVFLITRRSVWGRSSWRTRRTGHRALRGLCLTLRWRTEQTPRPRQRYILMERVLRFRRRWRPMLPATVQSAVMLQLHQRWVMWFVMAVQRDPYLYY